MSNSKVMLLPLLLLSCLLCIPKATAQGTEAERLLQKGIKDYDDLEFESAIESLERAVRLGLPGTSKVEAYKYLGFSYIVEEQVPKAKEMFQKLLEIDSNYRLSPQTSPKLSQVFNEVKSRFKPPVQTGSIFVKSTPEGASIYLDGKLQSDKTPAVIRDIKAGTHPIKLSLEGYEDFEKSITVQANDMAEVTGTLNEIEKSRAHVESVKRAGAIFIESQPPEANIYLDETLQKDKTPATIEDVASGEHALRLSRPEYQDWKGRMTVEAGKTNRLSANLIPIPQKTETPKPLTPKKGGKLKWWLIGGGGVAVVATATVIALAMGGDDGEEVMPEEEATLRINIKLPPQ